LLGTHVDLSDSFGWVWKRYTSTVALTRLIDGRDVGVMYADGIRQGLFDILHGVARTVSIYVIVVAIIIVIYRPKTAMKRCLLVHQAHLYYTA
jgi:hypothetical protein